MIKVTHDAAGSHSSYPSAAPVFADGDYQADIIGQATTAAEAMAIYATYFEGTGVKAVKARKATPDRRGEGSVDGWVPSFAPEKARKRSNRDSGSTYGEDMRRGEMSDDLGESPDW